MSSMDNISYGHHDVSLYDDPSCASFMSSITIDYAAISVYFTMGTLALLLNTVMAWMAVRRGDSSQSVNSVLFVQLAVANVVMALFNLFAGGAWRLTVRFMGGNGLCKFVKMMEMIGVYAVAWTVAGMSVDGCANAFFPAENRRQQRIRGGIIAGLTWVIAIVGAIPQAIIFHVMQAPVCRDFYQCITFGSFSTDQQEHYYTASFAALAFFGPLAAICTCSVLLCISFAETQPHPPTRRVGVWMTFCTAWAFCLCWTPYFVLHLRHMFDWSWATSEDSTDLTEKLILPAYSIVVVSPAIFLVSRWIATRSTNQTGYFNTSARNTGHHTAGYAVMEMKPSSSR
ncbi:adipokinetic hormone/corazonin-related peptide receptor variant I-like [Paramacrobiotus metropolitanus]|uniref:adipokinetic hormone/corazonin-related peptide receptor variant I-like n=1 Tax=Paramacrobiotus metropolitanus TaxID=2943436 RepID=UPI0024460454|nr:adipokinetic hormone/corazonin-related peptide receptor variant I-like [Paramacrobiotus metropolitanus]